MDKTPSAPVALVTGAARGIGRGIVAQLTGQGATVVGADVLPLDEWATDHRASARLSIDLRSMKSCSDAVRATVERFGRLDYLVNNAAIIRRGAASSMSESDFAEVVDVNLVGAFRVSQAAYPALVKTRGAIVNIASINGLRAVPEKVSYSASKAGLIHMTRALALEWSRVGIRVNAVAPTLVETEINAEQRANPEWLSVQLAQIPLGRAATVGEVASAVWYLLSAAAGMVTGQVLVVDGGSTL